MTLIDGDRIITAQLYDDEHEEFIEEKMSIIDYVNAYTTEGVTTADDVFDTIRTEIEKVFCMSVVTNELRTPMEVKTEILQIIDKYKAESEVQSDTK